MSFTTAYILGLTLFFLLIYGALAIKLSRFRGMRKKRLKKLNIADAVETESPIEDQEAYLKERAQKGTSLRFNFLQKSLPILLLLLYAPLISLPFLGQIPSTYITIIAGIFSVIIGIACRPFLENLFAGFVITFFGSLKVGDTIIIDGEYGVIEEVSLLYSVLKRWDWVRVTYANSRLVSKDVVNMTMGDEYVWAYVEFHVSPDSDMGLVQKIATEGALASSHNNKSEEPSFWIMEMNPASTKIWVAAWADSPAEAWELKSDIRKYLSKEFKKQNIKSMALPIDSLKVA